MNFKATYRGKVKLLNSKQIVDFQSLTANLRKVFPKAQQPYQLYYYDGEDFICIESQEDFCDIPEDIKKIKIIIRYENQQLNQGMAILGQTIVKELNQSGYKDIQPSKQPKTDFKKQQNNKVSPNFHLPEQYNISNPTTNQVLAKSLSVSSPPKIKVEQQLPLQKNNSQPLKKVQIQNKQSQKKIDSQEIKQTQAQLQIAINKQSSNTQGLVLQVQNDIKNKSNKSVQAGFIHLVSCSICSSKNIVGTRWKCKFCYDFDLCQDCYSSNSHQNDTKTKDHTFFSIKTDQFWKVINFRQPIWKLLNPEYVKEQNAEMLVEEWIKEEDIINCTPKFALEVQKAAASILNQIRTDLENMLQEEQIKYSSK